MCKILEAVDINGKWMLSCSEYDGDFLNAQKLKITSNENISYETNDFVIEKSKPCFSKGGAPWILLKKPIPHEFLKRGNEVYLN